MRGYAKVFELRPTFAYFSRGVFAAARPLPEAHGQGACPGSTMSSTGDRTIPSPRRMSEPRGPDWAGMCTYVADRAAIGKPACVAAPWLKHEGQNAGRHRQAAWSTVGLTLRFVGVQPAAEISECLRRVISTRRVARPSPSASDGSASGDYCG